MYRPTKLDLLVLAKFYLLVIQVGAVSNAFHVRSRYSVACSLINASCDSVMRELGACVPSQEMWASFMNHKDWIEICNPVLENENPTASQESLIFSNILCLQVFKDLELFLTPHIQPGPRDMKTIIECGGGSVITEDQALARVQVPVERRKPFYVVSPI